MANRKGTSQMESSVLKWITLTCRTNDLPLFICNNKMKVSIIAASGLNYIC